MPKPASKAERVNDVIFRWALAREEGTELSPEELCRDCHDLLARVRRSIKGIKALEAFEAHHRRRGD